MPDDVVTSQLVEAAKDQIKGAWNRLSGIKEATEPIKAKDLDSDLKDLREAVKDCFSTNYEGSFQLKAEAAAKEAQARSFAMSLAHRKYQLGRAAKLQAAINVAAEYVRPERIVDIMSGRMNA